MAFKGPVRRNGSFLFSCANRLNTQLPISHAPCGDVARHLSAFHCRLSSIRLLGLQSSKHNPIEPSATFCEIAMDQFQQDRGETVMFQFCYVHPLTMSNALYALIANRKVWLISHMARFNGNSNFKYRMAQWIMGRYGIDELTQALMLLGCAFVLVNFFAHSSILSTLALLLMALGIFRCYSKNIPARARELAKYQELMVKPKAWWRLLNKKWINRKTTIYFKCKGCGAVLNVPKGKGKILVTCPKGGAKEEKRS